MSSPILERRCATHDVSTGDRSRLRELENGFIAESNITEADLSTTIKVRFIHIVDGANGRISATQRAAQIAVLNAAYEFVGLAFEYDENEVTEVSNTSYFTMGHRSLRERNCKSSHQAMPPEEGLNLYTAQPGGGILGWATFPHEMEGDPIMDGVVLLHSSLPGGAATPYNLGMTAVHEVGHWLGLFHTFQDGCNVSPHGVDGDQVTDTPPHSGANYGTPGDDGHPHNLCPNAAAGSLCPVHNYMNYVDDNWMNVFTSGQKDRIWAQIGMFRPELIQQPEARHALESGTRIIW